MKQILQHIEAVLIKQVNKKMECSRSVPGIFNQYFTTAIKEKLELGERLLVTKCNQLADEALRLSRSENYYSAGERFREIEPMLNGSPNELTSLVMHSIYLPALAYLEYKKGNFEEALSLLKKGMETDEALISKFNFEILEMHRVQQLNNKMRIYMKLQHYRRAFGTGIKILHFIDRQDRKWTLDFRPLVSMSNIPLKLQEQMYFQVLSELVSALYYSDKCGDLLNRLVVTHPAYGIAESWNLAYLKSKQNYFDDGLLAFLDQDFETCPVLLYSINYEIIKKISVYHSVFNSEIHELLHSITSIMQNLPVPNPLAQRIRTLSNSIKTNYVRGSGYTRELKVNH